MSAFDNIIAGMQQIPVVDQLDGIDSPEAAGLALSDYIQTGSYIPPQRLTTPIYETPDSKTAPIGSPWKEQASPFPSLQYKADINKKQGLITAYMTVYRNSDGTEFVDPYLDVVEPGSFTKTIRNLETARKSKNNPYLCAFLWQHDRKEVIGGIKALSEDSKGVIYVGQCNMAVRRAREAFELAAEKQVGSSFGYDPVQFHHKGDIRHLTEIRLHETSLVTFPANDIAPILDVKSMFFVPANLPSKQPVAVDRIAIKTNLKTASSLFEQLTSQLVKAHSAYKAEAEWHKPRVR